ncbi:MAG TPA: hypothetical protein VMH22_06030 [bacterium]|nr:hypothetical protein [bacterium]
MLRRDLGGVKSLLSERNGPKLIELIVLVVFVVLGSIITFRTIRSSVHRGATPTSVYPEP